MNISIQSGYGKIPNRKSSVFGTFMQHLINFIIFYVTIITKDLDILIKLCQGKIKKLAKMIYSFNYFRELALSYSLEFVELYKKHSKGFSFFFFYLNRFKAFSAYGTLKSPYLTGMQWNGEQKEHYIHHTRTVFTQSYNMLVNLLKLKRIVNFYMINSEWLSWFNLL